MNKKCLNLKNGKIIDRKREHFFTFEIKANMDKVMTSTPKAQKFFLNFMSGNTEKLDFLKQILGCMLTGYAVKYVFSFYGAKGDNGKSVVINQIMRAAVGDYHRTISKDIILKRANKSSKGPSPELIELKGGRIGVLSEINEGEYIDEEVYKLLSSKDDFIEARNHHDKKMTKFINTCKPIFLLNKPYHLDTSDNATLNRIININCEAEFKHDPKEGQYKKDDNLIKYLLSADGLAEVLSFLVQGSIKFISNKFELKGKIMQDQKKMFLDLVDPVECYVNNHVKFSDKYKDLIPRHDIIEDFKFFLKSNKSKVNFNAARSKLYARLSVNARFVKKAEVRGYDGLKLIGDEDVEGKKRDCAIDDERSIALRQNLEKDKIIQDLRAKIQSLQSQIERMSTPKPKAEPIVKPKPKAEPIVKPKAKAEPIVKPKAKAEPIVKPKSESKENDEDLSDSDAYEYEYDDDESDSEIISEEKLDIPIATSQELKTNVPTTRMKKITTTLVKESMVPSPPQ